MLANVKMSRVLYNIVKSQELLSFNPKHLCIYYLYHYILLCLSKQKKHGKNQKTGSPYNLEIKLGIKKILF